MKKKSEKDYQNEISRLHARIRELEREHDQSPKLKNVGDVGRESTGAPEIPSGTADYPACGLFLHQSAEIAKLGYWIWDDIEEEPHLTELQLIYEGLEFGIRADFRIDPCRVDRVITVRASRARFEDGRSIEVGDSELCEVTDNGSGVLKAELAVELNSVRCDRNFHGHLRTETLSFGI